ncbi:MAG: cytoplasmic protein, partial [Rhizobiaceae bacterium]|nr:cytoplasmic protein [Rhizobiaceae bacterium]
MDELASADPPGRQRLIARIDRALERERLKGLSRHWSYDLNRHIALKQAR